MARHGFPNNSIDICLTLREFSENLKSIESTQCDFRKVFIVPTHSSLWGRKEDGSIAKRLEEFPQHIFAVVLEKKEEELHISLLDPMIRSKNNIIDPDHIGLSLEKSSIPFTEQELVLSYILESKLKAETTTLYHSKVLREKSNGCWAFALKDAVTFLKSADFFKSIKTEVKHTKLGEYTLKGIDVLPPSFMKTAQLSVEEFENYFRLHPDQDDQFIREQIKKHQLDGLNLRIGHATVKWLNKLCS